MSTSHNLVKRFDNYIIKSYGAKTPYIKYFFRMFIGFLGFNQPIEYGSAHCRKKFEEGVLNLWADYGLNVPDIIQVTDQELHMSIIKGRTFNDIFSKNIDFDLIDKLFREINERHVLACKYNEPLLCHIDANLRNLIYSDNKIFHIDFEMGREYEDVDMWSQREVTKLLISLSQATDKDTMQNILHRFLDTYTQVHIIENFINLKIGGKSNKSIVKKIEKNGYTLINLAVDLNEHLDKRTND